MRRIDTLHRRAPARRAARHRLLLVLLFTVLGGPAVAQDFEPVPLKPYDPDRPPGIDPTLDCSAFPRSGPDPRELGLPAALAAAERKELTLGGFGTTLAWAEREPDPAYIPVLKRIVERFRCADYDVNMAFLAIEAAGEPSAYFVEYAQGWERDDRLAGWAMNVLAVRGDSSVYLPLRQVALDAPNRGRFGRVLQNYFSFYLGGIILWDRLQSATVSDQLRYALVAAQKPLGSWVVRGTQGDSLSQVENLRNRYISAIPRRVLRRMGEVYPTATARALVAYEDSARAELAERGVAPEHVLLYMELVRRHSREFAFPSTRATPPVVGSAALSPSVCATVSGRRLVLGALPEGSPVARFSYRSDEAEAVRVPYGAGNSLVGPWDSSDPFAPVPPEVFDPGLPAHDRAFRVPLAPGEAVSWTLLGRTVTADAYTARCDGAPAPARPTAAALRAALPAAVTLAGPADAKLSGDDLALSGLPVRADGAPDPDPAPAHAVAVATADGRADVLDGLGDAARVTGRAPAPDVAVAAAPDSLAAWATALAERAAPFDPDDPNGTVGAPVVVAGPDVKLDGGGAGGAGVLVVLGKLGMKDAAWTGLVVVVPGPDGSVDVKLSAGARVVGALVVLGPGKVGVKDAAVLYSPEALALAAAAVDALP